MTAQRVGEVAGIVRSELDMKAREWRLPAVAPRMATPMSCRCPILRSKSSRKPLADAGEGAPAVSMRQWLAVAVRWSRARFCAEMKRRGLGRFGIAPWSAHDLRRTALRAWRGLGVVPIVLGHVANHRTTTRAGVTCSPYSQYTYSTGKAHSTRSVRRMNSAQICTKGAKATITSLGRRKATA